MFRPPYRSRLATAGAVALTAALVLTGCGADGGSPANESIDPDASPESVTGSLTVMRNPGEMKDEQIAEFESMYPNLDVTVIDYDSVKLSSLQAAGSPPDVFRVEGPAVGPLVAQGLLLDLTEPFESAGITAETTYQAADIYVADGKRYGLPKDWSPDLSIFVNNALFEQAGVAIPDPSTPITWAEVKGISEKLQAGLPQPSSVVPFGGAWDTFSPARFLSARLAESGQLLYSEDEKSIELTSNPDAVEFLGYMADMAKAGLTTSPLDPSATWAGDDFTKGTVAMAMYGYWFNTLLNTGETAVGTNYTVLPAPYWSDEDSRVDPTVTGTGYVVSSATKNPQAAWEFMKWYLTGDQAQGRAEAASGLPILKSDASLLPQDSDVNKQAYSVVTNEAEVSPALQFNKYYDDSVFTASYNKYLQDYLAGSITIDEMAQSIEDEVNAAIQDGVLAIGG